MAANMKFFDHLATMRDCPAPVWRPAAQVAGFVFLGITCVGLVHFGPGASAPSQVM